MSILSKMFSAESLGGETGGAMLDLLKQIQAAGQAGITAGISQKEEHLENFLTAKQDVFKMRYENEEPFIIENGKRRPLKDKELMGAAFGITPKGMGWEARPETVTTPMSWREYKLSQQYPGFEEFMETYRSASLAGEKFKFAKRKYEEQLKLAKTRIAFAKKKYKKKRFDAAYEKAREDILGETPRKRRINLERYPKKELEVLNETYESLETPTERPSAVDTPTGKITVPY